MTLLNQTQRMITVRENGLLLGWTILPFVSAYHFLICRRAVLARRLDRAHPCTGVPVTRVVWSVIRRYMAVGQVALLYENSQSILVFVLALLRPTYISSTQRLHPNSKKPLNRKSKSKLLHQPCFHIIDLGIPWNHLAPAYISLPDSSIIGSWIHQKRFIWLPYWFGVNVLIHVLYLF